MDKKNILDRVGRHSGMTVPDGYFREFAARMAASLPEQEWERSVVAPVRRSVWQIIRPYVYMAAMFMGVWCMMHIFNHIRPSSGISIEDNPVLAEAVSNATFINDYILDDANSDELLDDVWNESI